jgi:RpiR family carbohydrate utilization transcriptional regulator
LSKKPDSRSPAFQSIRATASRLVLAGTTRDPNVPLVPLIRGLLPNLKRAQRYIAEAVVKDPEQFIAQSISEVAQHCGVSTGSVVLFCKSLGLKGFPQLKVALARSLAEPLFASQGGAGSRDGRPGILQEVFQGHIKALRETLRLNSERTLDAAVKALAKSHRIVLFSIGLSYPVAYSLYTRMRFLGFPASSEYDSHLQLASAAELQRGDVAVGISLSGSTRETVECLRLSKERGAKTICITNSIDSPLARSADIRLYAAPSEVKYFQAPLTSRLTQLGLADVLLAMLGLGCKRKAVAHLERAEEHLLKRRIDGLNELPGASTRVRGRPTLASTSPRHLSLSLRANRTRPKRTRS